MFLMWHIVTNNVTINEIHVGDGVRLNGQQRRGGSMAMSVFIKIKTEPQNIEQEISNDEVWIRCAQSF